MTIYTTREWKGYGKHNYYWNEYRLENGSVKKYKCNRRRHFDGQENDWVNSERCEASWLLDDPSMPEWIRKVYEGGIRK